MIFNLGFKIASSHSIKQENIFEKKYFYESGECSLPNLEKPNQVCIELYSYIPSLFNEAGPT
jgi:hypothetical protein